MPAASTPSPSAQRFAQLRVVVAAAPRRTGDPQRSVALADGGQQTLLAESPQRCLACAEIRNKGKRCTSPWRAWRAPPPTSPPAPRAQRVVRGSPNAYPACRRCGGMLSSWMWMTARASLCPPASAAHALRRSSTLHARRPTRAPAVVVVRPRGRSRGGVCARACAAARLASASLSQCETDGSLCGRRCVRWNYIAHDDSWRARLLDAERLAPPAGQVWHRMCSPAESWEAAWCAQERQARSPCPPPPAVHGEGRTRIVVVRRLGCSRQIVDIVPPRPSIPPGPPSC